MRCGAAFSDVRAVRPARRYCGVRCRRATEYEVRRVRRRLDGRAAELARRLNLDRANRGLLSTLRGLDGSTWADDTAATRCEVAALRARLVALRGGPVISPAPRRTVPAPAPELHRIPGRTEVSDE